MRRIPLRGFVVVAREQYDSTLVIFSLDNPSYPFLPRDGGTMTQTVHIFVLDARIQQSRTHAVVELETRPTQLVFQVGSTKFNK